MVDVNVEPFEIELATRRGVKLRADVYLPKGGKGPYPTLLAASPYQKYHHDRAHPSHLLLPERPR